MGSLYRSQHELIHVSGTVVNGIATTSSLVDSAVTVPTFGTTQAQSAFARPTRGI